MKMEKLMHHYDREYMKLAMLKHEETFREQVYELHRLYRIQKTLMKDIGRNQRTNLHYKPQLEARKRLDLERPAEAYNFEEAGGKCRLVSEMEDDQNDLELTLGPRSYYHKKIKAAEPPALQSDSGPSFSSSSTESSHIKGEFLSQQKWGPERPAMSNQEKLNSPPWLFQALSLNMT